MQRPDGLAAGSGSRLRRRLLSWRRHSEPQVRALVLLVLALVGLTVAVSVWPDVLPVSVLIMPLVVGTMILEPRQLLWFVGLFLLCPLVVVLYFPDPTPRFLIQVGVAESLGVMGLATSAGRDRLGVARVQSESMLIDLRERIQRQGRLPALPGDWYVESALRSAEGTPFAGDFVVAVREAGRLQIVVVDVSGKGTTAGIRALLLTGALGGLLGALEPKEFLPAANDYLLRQDWDEGFATAVHLSVELASGDFDVWTAGHPPAVRLNSGTGRWTPVDCTGPVLGLIEGADFEGCHGTLRPGDVMLLYTDGVVESRHRDIGLGIDRLTGQAERVLHQGHQQAASRLIDRLGSDDDDRALLLLHRR